MSLNDIPVNVIDRPTGMATAIMTELKDYLTRLADTR